MLSAEVIAVQDERIAEVVERESAKLRNFIARQVEDAAEAEDILQDVFYEYVSAARMTETIERASAWLFRVAKNRIIDRFREEAPGSHSAILKICFHHPTPVRKPPTRARC